MPRTYLHLSQDGDEIRRIAATAMTIDGETARLYLDSDMVAALRLHPGQSVIREDALGGTKE